MMRSRRTPESIDRAQTTKKSRRGRQPKNQLAESDEEESAEKEPKIAMAAATTKSLQDILKASRDARGSQAKVYLNRELLDANFTHLLYANENGRNSTSEAPGLLADWLKRNPIKHGYGPNLS